MTAPILTQAQLKKLLHYNPDTGIFTRLRNTTRSDRVGEVAGGRNSGGHVQIKVNNYRYLAHRLAFLYMTGAFPPYHTDHENHIRHDNRWCNIRAATRSENSRNRKIPANNTSGTIGVSWHKASGKWVVQLRADGKSISGGYFTNKQKAIAKRKQLEKEHNFHANHGT